MKNLIWPETLQPHYYQCHICQGLVDSEANMDNDHNQWYTPSSRYWNPIRKEIYCGAVHMFEHHLKITNHAID